MKSAYELAMERLNKASPSIRLSQDQKKQLAELDSRYKARIAEREITLKAEIQKATAGGDFESVEKLQQQLAHERRSLLAELEDKKQQVQ